jgi:hypothetical protein
MVAITDNLVDLLDLLITIYRFLVGVHYVND